MLRYSALTNTIAAVALSVLMLALPAQAQKLPSKGIEGTWVVAVHDDNPPPGLPADSLALESYATGGSLVSSSTNPLAVRTGQGAWAKDGSEYAVVLVFFLVDANGVQTGSVYVRHRITINADGTFTGAGTGDVLDLDGNTLATVTFTSRGERLVP